MDLTAAQSRYHSGEWDTVVIKIGPRSGRVRCCPVLSIYMHQFLRQRSHAWSFGAAAPLFEQASDMYRHVHTSVAGSQEACPSGETIRKFFRSCSQELATEPLSWTSYQDPVAGSVTWSRNGKVVIPSFAESITVQGKIVPVNTVSSAVKLASSTTTAGRQAARRKADTLIPDHPVKLACWAAVRHDGNEFVPVAGPVLFDATFYNVLSWFPRSSSMMVAGETWYDASSLMQRTSPCDFEDESQPVELGHFALWIRRVVQDHTPRALPINLFVGYQVLDP